MMKVAINARLLASPNLRGWNRYCVNLMRELAGLGVKLLLYSDRSLDPSHLARLPAGSFSERFAPPMRYIQWEQRWLPKQCAVDGVDLLHTPFNFGVPWSSHCPRVLTLHDAIDQAYYGAHSSLFQRFNPAALRSWLYSWVARTRAHQIITVSEHSKSDLVNYLKIPLHKITVIPEAADSRFHEPISMGNRQRIRKRYSLPRRYIFYVGGWEKRKNVPFLLKALAIADLADVSLVLAGGREDQRVALAQSAESLSIPHRVRLLGWVEDADLPALYAESICFVYPSMYEGFGLQLCEAMAVGCAILAARTTSLPEVLGFGGATFPVDDPTFLATLLRRVVTDSRFREALKRRARERSRAFSWLQTARRTIDVYSTTLRGRGVQSLP